MRYDALIVGAGHNGLICACYLAKAGLKVGVVERRNLPGGAVCTRDDLVPGFRLDVGSSVHIMIHLTPVLAELDLAREGLEYIEMDPWAYYPVEGTGKGISFYRSVERTCESIAQFSPRDAEAYRRYVERWTELNEGVFETFLAPPSPGRLFGTILKRNLFRPKSRKLWSSLDTARQLMAPYGEVIRETFEDERLRTAMVWLSAQSGPAPAEVASGDMFGWNAMIHKGGAKRAKGGSGALTTALVKCLHRHGGEIFLGSPVRKVRRSGKGWEVEAGDRVFEAEKVVAACHLKTFFCDLLEGGPADLRERMGKARVGSGFGMVVRHAVEELPMYGKESICGAKPLEYHSAMQLLCRDREMLDAGYHDFLAGRPPANPSVVAMTFSSIDPTLAPPGKHTLFTWAQYHSYELKNGENWDAIREREADKIYDLVCQYAPNMRGKMIGRYIQTPLDLERDLGLLRGNVMHFEMSLDQMFMFRPLPEISCYRAPMKGLYLTGSSTHPGGGVFGAGGRNTAKVILGWRG
ncbi:MAG: NAD(P)/FAD-dependent oxidoreductase [Verrucomicrobia bacterium]|nr:NAD(P)/FAD-dependent oxidoreductase [Verrucomicrobiota bacterium]